jgi:hypothetical protein
MSLVNKKRSITSVSVSPFMNELLIKYNLSPTEVFRRGIAVSLYDLGIEQYNTLLNKERLIYLKKFFDIINDEEKMNQIKEILNKEDGEPNKMQKM